MSSPLTASTVRAIERLKSGDSGALEELFLPVYEELRGLAGRYLRPSKERTLQPTALVHEAYLRLMGKDSDLRSRTHFKALAARAMHQVLVDDSRRRGADKRGGDRGRITLMTSDLEMDGPGLDFFALQDALQKLEDLDERQSQVVRLRFFAGLTMPEIATTLEVSLSTVEAEWRHAKAWLGRELAP